MLIDALIFTLNYGEMLIILLHVKKFKFKKDINASGQHF